MDQVSVGNIDVARLLWRRKLTLLCAAAGAGLLAFIAAKALPVRYAADGMLLVEGVEPAVPELALLSRPVQPTGNINPRTEAAILRSRALAEAVVRDLQLAARTDYAAATAPPGRLQQAIADLRREATEPLRRLGLIPPRVPDTVRPDAAVEAAAEQVQRNLRIKSEDNQRLIWVSAVDRTPELAAAVANSAMEQFIAREAAGRQEQTAQANRWLTERATALRAELDAAEAKVQALRADNALFTIQAGSLTAVQLNTEQALLATARHDLARLETALATAGQVAARSGGISATQEVLSSPVVQRLREQEAAALQRYSGFSRRLGSQHPDTLIAGGELADLRRQIDFEVGKVMAALRRDAEIARSRVEEHQRAVARIGADAERAAGAEIALNGLLREADAKRQVYHSFLARADQTRMAAAQLPAARIVSRAVPPVRPSAPPAALVATFGAFAGLFLAAGASIIGPMLRRRVGSAGELAALTGLPNIGSLPVRRLMPARILKADQSDAAETLRGIRLALQPRRGEGSVVLVTSLGRGDGKTTVAASLARLCAADGLRVLLVEGDLRRPGLAAALAATPAAPLEAVLADDLPFDGALHVDAASGLHCLLAAGDARNPQALLASPRLGALLDEARRRYDLVVVDSPPVLRVADPVLLAREADRILLVVGWDRTPRNALAHAVERFPAEAQARMATVLNRVPARDLAAQGYYAGYGRAPSRRLPLPSA